jgi:AAA+ ATPase superfamily predicted ATPase
MKFYDREKEIEVLLKNREMSKRTSVFTVITGRRRIGKTALIRESEKNARHLYFFVQRQSEARLCEKLVTAAKNLLGIKLVDSGRFHDLFMQLMEYGEKNNFTFIIDEFQDLERVDPSIMSSIQELWDEYRSRSRVNLIVCGSVHSMMIRIFQNNKEPLFGRATFRMNIGAFRPSVVKEILKDHNPDFEPDDLLMLYMLSGGVPKYIEILMDSGATTFDRMLDAVCSTESIFITDGRELIISEFGKDHATYFTILELIANGKNTLREINDSTGKDSGTYLENLEKEYGLIRKNRPIFSKENSRDVRWQISDNYLRFYFRFISSNQSLVEFGDYDGLRERISAEYTQYSGAILENYFKDKISEEERLTEIGSYWDRKGQNEIDIIAVNDMSMKAMVAEVKRNPKKADINELKEKAELVSGLKGYDTEYRILSLDDIDFETAERMAREEYLRNKEMKKAAKRVRTD